VARHAGAGRATVGLAIVALIVVGAGLSSYLIDSRQRGESYEQLRHMALYDSLTALPNRASFNAYLEQASCPTI